MGYKWNPKGYPKWLPGLTCLLLVECFPFFIFLITHTHFNYIRIYQYKLIELNFLSQILSYFLQYKVQSLMHPENTAFRNLLTQWGQKDWTSIIFPILVLSEANRLLLHIPNCVLRKYQCTKEKQCNLSHPNASYKMTKCY